MSDDTVLPFCFPAVCRKKVVAAFDGGRISSDGGVRVKRIVLSGAAELREISMDHPDLAQGWWDVEHDGPMMSRWTNGDAVLPLPAMTGNVMLEIQLAGSMIFLEEAVPLTEPQQRTAA